MTEVREVSTGSKGLFATKKFSKGDEILLENPLVVVAPDSDEESKRLKVEWFGEQKVSASKKDEEEGKSEDDTLWSALNPPAGVATEFRGTFRGLVQAGICWMKLQTSLAQSEQTKLLELYHPDKESPSEHEKTVLKVTDQAIEYLQEHKPSSFSDFEDWDTLRRVLLIWACNSFEGGRLYYEISRVNHHCDPNAIIQPVDDSQRLVAAADIASGEEISISYLGLMLYSETKVRKQCLAKTKYFDCHCSRCSSKQESGGEKEARIPCPTCHRRELPQHSLEEDVQYDDDQTVQYATPTTPCSKCHNQPDDGKLQKIMDNVTQKLVAYMDTINGKSTGQASDDEEEDGVLEEHVSLASTIMGDKHWTTNLLMLIHLDRRLSQLSQAMLTTQELPEMEDVAELIDSLQRVCRFIEVLELKLDRGHVLGDVIIGVARLLVALGDVKSQKYGAEWLEKVTDYCRLFESEGQQKVVAALATAWKNNNRPEVDEPATKKSKQS